MTLSTGQVDRYETVRTYLRLRADELSLGTVTLFYAPVGYHIEDDRGNGVYFDMEARHPIIALERALVDLAKLRHAVDVGAERMGL